MKPVMHHDPSDPDVGHPKNTSLILVKYRLKAMVRTLFMTEIWIHRIYYLFIITSIPA